jgi:hypothetical protein
MMWQAVKVEGYGPSGTVRIRGDDEPKAEGPEVFPDDSRAKLRITWPRVKLNKTYRLKVWLHQKKRTPTPQELRSLLEKDPNRVLEVKAYYDKPQ